MDDRACVHFLQWALPRLGFRWRGFRKVRRQVCRRIARRLVELNLSDLNDYRKYLASTPDEWATLDRLCRVTISRFYRDHVIFEYFRKDIFPALLKTFHSNNCTTFRIWSAGCASGEEPYSMALLYHFLYQETHPDISLEILGTDIDPAVIRRAEKGCYSKSSLRELPDNLLANGFETDGENENYLLKKYVKKYVRFEQLDIRSQPPEGKFHVVLCRNLAFTYFNEEVQQKVLHRICDATENGGILITGSHETINCENTCFKQWLANMPIYKKSGRVK